MQNYCLMPTRKCRDPNSWRRSWKKAIDDEEFMDALFSNAANVIIPEKKDVNVTVVTRGKAVPRFFPDEWED